MKIDFSKVYPYLKEKRLSISLLFSCMYLPVVFHLGYIFTTKEYYFILYDMIIGLSTYMVYDMILGRKLGTRKKKKRKKRPTKLF